MKVGIGALSRDFKFRVELSREASYGSNPAGRSKILDPAVDTNSSREHKNARA
jgi:hypothetical protein